MNHDIKDFQVQLDIDGIDIEKDYLTVRLIMDQNGQAEEVFEA